MHPYIRTPPYRPPAFAPSADATAPIQLPVNLSTEQLANELHAQLTRLARGRDLRALRRQACTDFRAVMRHVRARRHDGKNVAPLQIQRTAPERIANSRGRRRPRRSR